MTLVSSEQQADSVCIDYIPFKVITKQWLYFPVLYSIFLLLMYFTHSNLYRLIPYSHPSPPHFPLPTGIHSFVLCMHESVSVFLYTFA